MYGTFLNTKSATYLKAAEELFSFCHEDGGEPGKDSCNCPVCRAFRTETAEGRLESARSTLEQAPKDLAAVNERRIQAETGREAALQQATSFAQQLEAARKSVQSTKDELARTARGLEAREHDVAVMQGERSELRDALKNATEQNVMHVDRLARIADALRTAAAEL